MIQVWVSCALERDPCRLSRTQGIFAAVNWVPPGLFSPKPWAKHSSCPHFTECPMKEGRKVLLAFLDVVPLDLCMVLL